MAIFTIIEKRIAPMPKIPSEASFHNSKAVQRERVGAIRRVVHHSRS